jgi:hypothetical protein
MTFNVLRVIGLFALAGLVGACSHKSSDTISNPLPKVNYVVRPQSAIAWTSLATSAWPMARHDPQCTGRSNFFGPSKGLVRTTVKAGTEISDPCFSSDSVFYFVSDSMLYSATTAGTILWTRRLDGPTINESPPMVTADGTILVGSTSGSYYSFNSDGTQRWKTPLGAGPIYCKAVGISKTGTIYVGAGSTLSAIDKTGNLLWQKTGVGGVFQFGASSGIPFSPDGNTFYVPGNGAPASFYSLDLNGNIRWADTLGGPASGCPAVDNDGNIYLFAAGCLYSINPEGKTRWRIEGVDANWDLTIDINGNICFLSSTGLVSLDNSGQERWRVPLGGSDFITHLVSDAEGTVFSEVGSPGQYTITAVAIDGRTKWQLTVSAYVKVGGPALNIDRSMFFAQAGQTGGSVNQIYIIE